MAFPQITGTLKKKIITDITVAFSIGGVAAAYWWYGVHNGMAKTRDDWYVEYEKRKNQDE
ncbi:similar to Saccharomyces cerevisiae YDL067C COX9 Subunit VIIa of cytochrome c oxidase [Geotrichum candidum]|uniref:Cytochrome c oxidase subunit 9, mitochondrial n=1 Tax=Geotrichum candidum TaxID=1173061 RepID=A0A0J9XIC7_GEOCN|nr:similar to Saccharomyces cerevisiae YDL067C COX9 Subunit VIIa of cytochrome c oxidase [Geotrichum candidum]